MIIYIRGKIPITIFPTFWLIAALIGYLNSLTLMGTLIWVGIILVSVLFHEWGHALTALLFRRQPRIELVALGGLTYHEGHEKIPFWKQFLIVFNGPFFSFILALIATALLQFPLLAQGLASSILSLTQLVNMFWAVVNLIPVLPLDGGQLLRLTFEKCFGVRGLRYALITSTVLALLVSLCFFVLQSLLVGALFFLFAFQSYDLARRTRHLCAEDAEEDIKDKVAKIEQFLAQGDREGAATLCKEVRARVHRGVLYEMATERLALLEHAAGHLDLVYDLLQPLQKDLGGRSLCLLQEAALAKKDYPLVVQMAPVCFQTAPYPETALRSAYAHAQLTDVAAALGWLQTAVDEGLNDVHAVIKNPMLDPIRGSKPFKEFEAKL